MRVPRLYKINVPIPTDENTVFPFQDIQDGNVKCRKFDGTFMQFEQYDNPPMEQGLSNGKVIDFQKQNDVLLIKE